MPLMSSEMKSNVSLNSNRQNPLKKVQISAFNLCICLFVFFSEKTKSMCNSTADKIPILEESMPSTSITNDSNKMTVFEITTDHTQKECVLPTRNLLYDMPDSNTSPMALCMVS